MKFKLIAVSVFSLFFLFSCKYQNKNLKILQSDLVKSDSVGIHNSISNLVIDSVKVIDSMQISKNLFGEFEKSLLVFKGLNNAVLDSIYNGGKSKEIEKLKDFSKSGIQIYLKKDAKRFFVEMQDYGEDIEHPQNWFEISRMKVYNNFKNYLILNINIEGFSGGAHGYSHDIYKVIDAKKQKKIGLEDIVEVSKVNWNKVMLKSLDKGTEMLFEKNSLTFSQNFYFDDKQIIFFYNQYEIAAYAFGPIEIPVKFSEISNALKPEFKQRMGIK